MATIVSISTEQGLTFAGVPLIIPSAELVAWCRQNIPWDALQEFYQPPLPPTAGMGMIATQRLHSFGFLASYPWGTASLNPGFASLSPPGGSAPGVAMGFQFTSLDILQSSARLMPTPPRRQVEINKLYWPSGAARWAIGHFLCSDEQLKLIRPRAFVYNEKNGGFSPVARTLLMGAGETVTAQMYLQPPRRLADVPGLDGPVWLLTLVDIRYRWDRFPELKYLDYPYAPSFGDANYDLKYALGRLVKRVGKKPNYLLFETPDPKYLKVYLTYAYGMYIDAMLAQIGQRLVCFTDETKITNMGVQKSIDRFNANQERYDDSFRAGGLPTMPPQPDPAGGLPTAFNFWCDTNFGDPFNHLVKTRDLFPQIGGNGTQRGGVYPSLHLQTDGTPAHNPTNTATAINLFKLMARDFCLYQLTPADLVYDGICNWDLEGVSDYVEWTLRADECSTVLRRPPIDNGLTSLSGTNTDGNPYLSPGTPDKYRKYLNDQGWFTNLDSSPVVKICPQYTRISGVSHQTINADGTLASVSLAPFDVVTGLTIEHVNLTLPFALMQPGTCETVGNGINCSPCSVKVPSCGNRLIGSYLPMRVTAFAGDCLCVLDQLGFLHWTDADQLWRGTVRFFSCDDPGSSIPPSDPTQNQIPVPSLVVLVVELTLGLVLRTYGCNGHTGAAGGGNDYVFPTIATQACAPGNPGTPLFIRTNLFPVNPCCAGPNSLAATVSQIALSIAEAVTTIPPV